MFFIRRVCSCFQLAHAHVKMDARMELAPFVAAVAQEEEPAAQSVSDWTRTMDASTMDASDPPVAGDAEEQSDLDAAILASRLTAHGARAQNGPLIDEPPTFSSLMK